MYIKTTEQSTATTVNLSIFKLLLNYQNFPKPQILKMCHPILIILLKMRTIIINPVVKMWPQAPSNNTFPILLPSTPPQDFSWTVFREANLAIFRLHSFGIIGLEMATYKLLKVKLIFFLWFLTDFMLTAWLDPSDLLIKINIIISFYDPYQTWQLSLSFFWDYVNLASGQRCYLLLLNIRREHSVNCNSVWSWQENPGNISIRYWVIILSSKST